MSRVVCMCGPSGSGKSTYARRLEQQGMVRLSFDTAMWRRGISTVPLPPDVRAEIEAELRARLLELVAAGRDTVLARVRARSGEHPDDFPIGEELAAQYFDHFEPPTPDEGPLTVVRT